jgi:hypothetical protein
MYRIGVALVLLAWGAWGVRADEFYLHYDGNDFPENEGWNRFATDPPVVRSLWEGRLGLNAYGDISTAEYYSTDPHSFSVCDGEFLRVAWRMVTTRTGTGGATPSDVSIWVANEEQAAAVIWITPWFVSDGDYCNYEHIVPIAPREFHTYELLSHDLRSYDLFIDETLAFQSSFREWYPFPNWVAWGDTVIGMASVSSWDYVTVQVVPEPHSAVTLTAAGLVAVFIARSRRRPRASRRCRFGPSCWRWLPLLAGALTICSPASAQRYEPYSGGWVHIMFNAGTPDEDYFDVLGSGRVILREPGIWQIYWRDASGPPFGNGNPVNSAGVGQDLPGEHAHVYYHTLWVHAASLSGSLDPGNPSYADEYRMRFGIVGDVTNQASIYMAKGTLHNSYIGGNCNGRITIGRIKEFGGEDRALRIGGTGRTRTRASRPSMSASFCPREAKCGPEGCALRVVWTVTSTSTMVTCKANCRSG